jgi:hypothetical protein
LPQFCDDVWMNPIVVHERTHHFLQAGELGKRGVVRQSESIIVNHSLALQEGAHELDHIFCDAVDLLFGLHARKWVEIQAAVDLQ